MNFSMITLHFHQCNLTFKICHHHSNKCIIIYNHFLCSLIVLMLWLHVFEAYKPYKRYYFLIFLNRNQFPKSLLWEIIKKGKDVLYLHDYIESPKTDGTVSKRKENIGETVIVQWTRYPYCFSFFLIVLCNL